MITNLLIFESLPAILNLFTPKSPKGDFEIHLITLPPLGGMGVKKIYELRNSILSNKGIFDKY